MGPRLGTHTPKGSRLVLELLADAATITPAEVLSQNPGLPCGPLGVVLPSASAPMQ
jgi:hypothetical protein